MKDLDKLIFGLFEMLIEEPGKLSKFAGFLLKIILNSIFASWLYIHIIGVYQLIDFSSLKSWVEFIISGRILICSLLYLTSSAILFYFLPILTLAPLMWVRKKMANSSKNNQDNKPIIWLLRSFEVLDVDITNKKISLMNNADFLYDIAKSLTLKEAKVDIQNIKNSLLAEIVHTYLVFVILYFSILDNWSHNGYLRCIIITGAVLVGLMYIGISILLDILYKIAKDVVFLIDRLRCQNTMEEIFKDAGIFLHSVQANDKHYDKYFYIKKNPVAIKYFYDKRLIEPESITQLIKLSQKIDKKILLVCNKNITIPAIEVINDNKDLICFISYTNEED
jgi:hypothetical protein